MNNAVTPIHEPTLRFFWSEREDGAEIFCCERPDGSSCEILSAAEIQTAEELIALLAVTSARAMQA